MKLVQSPAIRYLLEPTQLLKMVISSTSYLGLGMHVILEHLHNVEKGAGTKPSKIKSGTRQ
ncbi:hypothetical protein GCM10008934_38210 [Virgibacillus salarius]